jgi:branched-chain amino acid transport system ATP-binding protein
MPLEVRTLDAGYGRSPAIADVSVTVPPGEIVSLIGSNGAGKTTLMKTVAGTLRPWQGQIIFDGRDITRIPAHRRIKLGMALVPEGRHVFSTMTVLENLRLGYYSSGLSTKERRQQTDLAFDLFPRLGERSRQPAGTLSGGEQQMLAIARGMVSQPRLLLLDEPSLGLAPKIVAQILQTVVDLNQSQGLSILLVEQNARLALRVAHRAYVLESGHVVLQGTGAELLKDDRVQQAYLKVTKRSATEPRTQEFK